MKKIVFVCLGNICRSPLAHTIMDDLINKAGLEGDILVDSAGTGGWHVGNPADARMRETAKKNGLTITTRAQQFTADAVTNYDIIFAMDRSNKHDILGLIQGHPEKKKVHLFREFDPQSAGDRDVPDPYYGGQDGFDKVFDIVKRTCKVILEKIRLGQL